MQFRVLSHAGLQVNAGGKELLCDPWVLGSCYWRSWWNYPPVPDSVRDTLKPDFVYLTHLHWDHFQGPSLRLFSKDTRFIVPYCRYDRIKRDLNDIGFHDVTELRHGERLQLASGLALRCYHFAPIFTDSAVVIEADDTVIFNANDAKLAGLPLQQILSDYPRIDFCMRSHNSANARQCMHVIGEPDAEMDENGHYVRAFAYFVNRVRPKYAVPFASNSCLLHRDVFHMNSLAQTPLHVKEYFDRFATRAGLDTRLQIMVPGDSWSSEQGFSIAQQDYFERREARLEEYATSVQDKLQTYYARESKVKITLDTMQKFVANLHRITPWILRRRLRNEPVLIASRSGSDTNYFAVDLFAGRVTEVAAERAGEYPIRAEFPSLVLLQSIRLNMFSQAWISKRVHYHATRAKLPVLQKFLGILELWEAEMLPLRSVFTVRSFKSLLPRWREGLLYVQVIAHVLRGRTFLEIERRLLGGPAANAAIGNDIASPV